MRYTPQGHAVTSFGVATNRNWKVEGELREETEFHNVVAWNKLAELCSQLLKKGTKIFVEGRLQTRDWTDEKGTKHYRTEIVAEDMIVLSRKDGAGAEEAFAETEVPAEVADTSAAAQKGKKAKKKDASELEDISVEDIPF